MPAITIEPIATTVAATARDRGEQHAGQHARHRKAAAQMADAGEREADDPPGDAAGRQKGRGQDEERDREQRVVLHGLEQLERQRGQRVVREQEDRGDARQPERDRDRRPDQEQAEQHRKRNAIVIAGRTGARRSSLDEQERDRHRRRRPGSGASPRCCRGAGACCPRLRRRAGARSAAGSRPPADLGQTQEQQATPIGRMIIGSHCGTGRSSDRMPILWSLATYCQEPMNRMIA